MGTAAPRLVLASRSPQRSAILDQLGVAYDVEPADVAEEVAGEPRELVLENALRKARTVCGRRGADPPVLGADTAVVVGGRPLGKPADAREARAFLEALAGRAHTVWSGVALLAGAGSGVEERTAADSTEVRFRRLDSAELDWYVDTGEWRERAGGYAIQGRGAALVEGIVGDYWNVVGLPVAELVRLDARLTGRAGGCSRRS